MLPRSKKGPSWADNVEEPQPSTSTSVPEAAVRKPSDPQEPPDGDERQEGISDLDWMRQRMKKDLAVSEEKAFEQSDEEDDHEEVRLPLFLSISVLNYASGQQRGVKRPCC